MIWPVANRYFDGFRRLVLLCSIFLGLDQLFIPWRSAGDIHPVSLVGYLPTALIENKMAFQICTGIFLISTTLWLLKLAPKILSIVSALFFILSTSWYLQNEPFGDHRQSVFSLLLILLALREWGLLQYYFYKTAAVVVLSFYCLAGWEKIFYSGLSWPNGTTLQVFVHSMGYMESYLGRAILHNHNLAVFFQWAILILECGAFVILTGPRFLRWIWLVALVGFHIGIEEIFHYRYYLHLIIVLYLFALPALLERKNVQSR
ncbi:hypothetical protein ACLVWU_07755 [Bdellovibrio sp. HCB290]|uniref:hypothetical protein n=1 Tax=Bdellovibrio sp. HCB290 TaxID=3394356 RepID=UPI0039B3E18E